MGGRACSGAGPRYKSPEGKEDTEAQQQVFKGALDKAALVLEHVAEAASAILERSRTAGADAEADARSRMELVEAMRDLLSMSFERWELEAVLALRAHTKAGG